jgi:hypothetical protein
MNKDLVKINKTPLDPKDDSRQLLFKRYYSINNGRYVCCY